MSQLPKEKPSPSSRIGPQPSDQHPEDLLTPCSETRDVSVSGNADGLQRRLGNRQIQLVAIGGSIGTALFVSIGQTLQKAGPGNLLLAFIVHNIVLAMVNNYMTEISVYMPVSGGFIRMAGNWVDDALGFMVGWNFFFFQVIVIPFEITAVTLVLSFWSENVPPAAVCAACIVLFACLNIMAVGVYGEAEFWLSSGKVFLLLIVFSFTFVTMVGGNPQADAYGFRYWKEPGAFAQYLSEGDLGRFQGFLAALWSAAFTCVGPEYISMIAAEAKHPRTYLKTAFKMVYWRFIFFFIGSALAVGVIVAYNDPTLTALSSGGSGASSPYVIAMRNLGIGVLPHIINALLVTTIFSAGNTYTYCATRTLHGLAVAGRAPKPLRKCTKQGVPIYCFAVVMAFPVLSFLQLSNSSAIVLTWLIDLATAATIIDYIVMCITYICFYRACVAQNFDRSRLPYKGWFQPWSAYIGLAWMTMIIFCYGYESFVPWSVKQFFLNYILLLMMPVFFLGWKYFKQTEFLHPEKVNIAWDALEITAYEGALTATEPPVGFWTELIQPFRRRDDRMNGEASMA